MSDATVATTPTSEGQSGQPQEQQSTGQGQSGGEYVRRADLQALQAVKDREIAQVQAEYRQAMARLQQVETRGMSEAEKTRYELEQAKQRIAFYEQQEVLRRQETELEKQKRDDAEALAETAGVDIEPLLKATSYRDMLDIAKKEKAKLAKAAASGMSKAEANRTYIPTGRPSTPDSRNSVDYKTAIANRDGMGAALAALRELGD